MDDETLTDEEIERRKQLRSGLAGTVQQARNAPVPHQAPPAETTPAQGEESE